MSSKYIERKRRFITIAVAVLIVFGAMFASDDMWQQRMPTTVIDSTINTPALDTLNKLEIKGRAPKTDYDRDKFGGGWNNNEGCDTRNIILNRDLEQVAVGDGCAVISGTLDDPYTGTTINFLRGIRSSSDVQIDHVVALSDAWQKGAQQLTAEQREALANDPLELLAVDGSANQQKSGSDAASWLPSNKKFRCQYIARQIAVKSRYGLWITQAEYNAMLGVLSRCPNQVLPTLR